MALRSVTIHQSLIRPVLLGGAERVAAMANGVFCMSIGFGTGSWQAALAAAVTFVVVHAVLVGRAKADPQWLANYARHVKYKDYYPAQSSPSAPETMVRYYKP